MNRNLKQTKVAAEACYQENLSITVLKKEKIKQNNCNTTTNSNI